MSKNINVVIVEKNGTLKNLTIKEFKEEELFKKCGFKKADNFLKQTEWSVKINGQKYVIMLYGKEDGKANIENKYDFPPPIDTKLLFGDNALKHRSEQWRDLNLGWPSEEVADQDTGNTIIFTDFNRNETK